MKIPKPAFSRRRWGEGFHSRKQLKRQREVMAMLRSPEPPKITARQVTPRYAGVFVPPLIAAWFVLKVTQSWTMAMLWAAIGAFCATTAFNMLHSSRISELALSKWILRRNPAAALLIVSVTVQLVLLGAGFALMTPRPAGIST